MESYFFVDFAGLGDIDGFLEIFIVNVSLFGITNLFSFSSSKGITEKFLVCDLLLLCSNCTILIFRSSVS